MRSLINNVIYDNLTKYKNFTVAEAQETIADDYEPMFYDDAGNWIKNNFNKFDEWAKQQSVREPLFDEIKTCYHDFILAEAENETAELINKIIARYKGDPNKINDKLTIGEIINTAKKD